MGVLGTRYPIFLYVKQDRSIGSPDVVEYLCTFAMDGEFSEWSQVAFSLSRRIRLLIIVTTARDQQQTTTADLAEQTRIPAPRHAEPCPSRDVLFSTSRGAHSATHTHHKRRVIGVAYAVRARE